MHNNYVSLLPPDLFTSTIVDDSNHSRPEHENVQTRNLPNNRFKEFLPAHLVFEGYFLSQASSLTIGPIGPPHIFHFLSNCFYMYSYSSIMSSV